MAKKKDTKPPRPPQTREKLREFGLVMATAAVIIGGILLYKGKPANLYLFIMGLLFLVPAVFAPRVLAPLERAWMTFAEYMSVIMTYIILTLTYYLLVTPLGLLMRLLGKDLLEVKLEPEAQTYWTKIEADGPGTRPYLPY